MRSEASLGEHARSHYAEPGCPGRARATIRGLRITVAHIVNLVANGMTPAQIVEELPDLEEEDVRQALAYAAALAQDELHPLRA